MKDMEEVVVGEMVMAQAAVEVDVDGKVSQRSGWLLVSESMLRGLYER